MIALVFAPFCAPFFAHADGGDACAQRAMSQAQYEYANQIRYSQSSDSFPEDKKYAACAGVPLQYDGATPQTGDSGYTYFRYAFHADCGGGVIWTYNTEYYPSLNCELRGE
jgi:hypothetical protein